ncbi:MAG: MBL fold metallo-hydrolase, partial [Gammaproteobacteria bacterium]|nr:MBL fold metallo-hydrolase [Gammaproteobacteria bacterium]
KFKQYYGELKPVAEDRIIEAADNFELDFNGRLLKFLDTPGHARHHFCIYDESSHGIFTGDTFGLSYPQLKTAQGAFIFPTTTPVQFDPQAMKNSIDRLLSLQPQHIYLTHFGRITPTAEIVAQLKQGIDAFTAIALSEKENASQRTERIAERMMDYLLQQLQKMNCEVAENTCRDILQNDITLNSQGLEYWLDNKDK